MRAPGWRFGGGILATRGRPAWELVPPGGPSMWLMPLAAVVGCGVGHALGGRLSNFSNLRLRGWSLLALAVVIQGFLGWAPSAFRWQLVILCGAAAAGWCLANRARRGVRLGLLLLG